LNRSEHLLREGLSVAEVRDRDDLAERFADLYEEQGRMEEAREIRRQARGGLPAIQHTLESRPGDSALRQEVIFPLGDEKGRSLGERPSAGDDPLRVSSLQATAGRQKVGRNDPCPCGSGKKFKRCCGG
jgi:preprotein translocase subunit SecA